MRSATRPALQPMLRKALSASKILSAERERELLVRYHTDADKAAMDELVRSHMPMIFRVAGGSARNNGVDINDLVQTATEGLLIAINRWSFEKSDASVGRLSQKNGEVSDDTELNQEQGDAVQPSEIFDSPRSCRLATYAMWWMRILLTDSVIQQRGVITRAKNPKVRKALFCIPMVVKKLDLQMPLCGADVERIAEYLGINAREIEEALIHAAGDVMLDEPVGDGTMLRGEVIADLSAEGEDGILTRLASEKRWDAVCEVLMELPTRDRFILITRYLVVPKWKLDRLSDRLKMSRERIRQVAVDALARINKALATAETARERRRPGRPEYVNPALLPLLRGESLPVAGAKPGLATRSSEQKIADLVTAIERVSATADPAAMAAFMRDQHLTIGPTRVTGTRSALIDT